MRFDYRIHRKVVREGRASLFPVSPSSAVASSNRGEFVSQSPVKNRACVQRIWPSEHWVPQFLCSASSRTSSASRNPRRGAAAKGNPTRRHRLRFRKKKSLTRTGIRHQNHCARVAHRRANQRVEEQEIFAKPDFDDKSIE